MWSPPQSSPVNQGRLDLHGGSWSWLFLEESWFSPSSSIVFTRLETEFLKIFLLHYILVRLLQETATWRHGSGEWTSEWKREWVLTYKSNLSHYLLISIICSYWSRDILWRIGDISCIWMMYFQNILHYQMVLNVTNKLQWFSKWKLSLTVKR